MARATRTIDTTGMDALDRQRADLAERELDLLRREASIRTEKRDIATAREEIVTERNALFDERQRLVDLRRRVSDQMSKLSRKQRSITTGQEVRKRERAEIREERRELDADRKAFEAEQMHFAHDRAVADGDEIPEPTQLKLVPELLDPELSSIRRAIVEMREWDEAETADIWAAMLNAVQRIEEQGRAQFERRQAIRTMWTHTRRSA